MRGPQLLEFQDTRLRLRAVAGWRTLPQYPRREFEIPGSGAVGSPAEGAARVPARVPANFLVPVA